MKEKIINAQKRWADGIIRMGELSNDRNSLEDYTNNFLEEMYDFENNQLLFKPTKASDTQFRNTREMALSYFIAGENKECDEDQGFALSKWSKITFENSQITINGDLGFAMGNYYFQSIGQKEEIKVEYTFGYIKGSDGELVINIHHSSLPYKNDQSNIG